MVEEGGIDPILRGLFAAPAKKNMPNEVMNAELTEKLFEVIGPGQNYSSCNIAPVRNW